MGGMNSCFLNRESESPEQYKIAIIKNLIYCAILISVSKAISCSEIKNIKQTLINVFPNYIAERIKSAIKNINSNFYENNTKSNISELIALFFLTRYTQYNLNEIELKKLISNKDPTPNYLNNKINLIIYYPIFNTTNLVVSNNFSPLTSNLTTTNVIYEFKYPLEVC